MNGYFVFGPCRALFSEGKKAELIGSISAGEEKMLLRLEQYYSFSPTALEPLEEDELQANIYSAIEASKQGYLQVLKYIRKKGVDIFARNNSCLYNASRYGHFNLAKYLVMTGAVADEGSLKIASKNGQLRIVKYLTEAGARISSIAVHAASENGHLNVLKYLMENKGDITIPNFILADSALQGHLEVVKYLESQGLNIRVYEDRAFRYAAGRGHLKLAKYLESKGADIRAENDYAVRYASKDGHLKTVKYLVSKGANPSAEDWHALQMSSSNGHLNIVKYLVVQGVDFHHDDGNRGVDITSGQDESVQRAMVNGHLNVLKYLISQGANTTGKIYGSQKVIPFLSLPELEKRKRAALFLKIVYIKDLLIFS